MKLGFIGTGNMATAMMGGIIKNKIVPAEEIIGADPFAPGRERVKANLGINVTDKNTDVIEQAEIVVLSVKPQFYESVINEIKDDCEKLCKIYINSSKFKDGMGVIPVTRESKFITVAVNTKVGNPRGSVMVAESITESLEEFDEYIRLTGEIRNSLFLDKEIKDDLLKFINSSDCKFFYNKNKIFEVFKLFYDEDIVSKIKSLGKEE